MYPEWQDFYWGDGLYLKEGITYISNLQKILAERNKACLGQDTKNAHQS